MRKAITTYGHSLTASLALLLALLFSACHEHGGGERFSYESEHTLLLYMIGDNTLSSCAATNIEQCIAGLRNTDRPLNLIVYKDTKESGSYLPQLFQLKRNAANPEQIDTVYIKQWKAELNSADPEVLTEVMDYAFGLFDTEVKGLEIWSHGMSWLPSSNFKLSQERATTKALTYIGQDNSNFMELWELREALEAANSKLDYILFDACHMGTAEVLYEMKDVCSYLFAPITEVMSAGFPYATFVQSLSAIQSKESLESVLPLLVDDFEAMYPTNGTCALLATRGADNLYEQCLALNEAADRCAAWAPYGTDSLYYPLNYERHIQHYGRLKTGMRYFFYDVKDWANAVVADSLVKDYDLQPLYDALNSCVLDYFYSPYFSASGDAVAIDSCCGLAMSVPVFWQTLSSYAEKLDQAYTKIGWRLEEK